jgi:TRAP-type C4-dicarboxylate transport system permease large subunit
MANPIVSLAGARAEPLTFLLMLLSFGFLAIALRWPIGLSLLAAAFFGAILNGEYFPLRHLVEGAFAYLDPILVIATAMIFMRTLADSGGMYSLGKAVEERFQTRPALLLALLMLIIMFPGMITGSSTASVLTTGAMTASIMVRLGLSKERTAAIIALGGVLGMVAPPVNIPAMIIGGGVDLPYVGFDAPLALASFPLAGVILYALAWPILVRSGQSPASRASGSAPSQGGVPAPRLFLLRTLVGPLVAAVLMVAPRLAPTHVPDVGLPLVFLTATAASVVVLPGFPLFASMTRAVAESLGVLGILCGVGAFIQVMTLTGCRGWLVSVMTGAPSWAIFAAAAVSLPLFGAVSAFGSASVLGVPFLMALLGRNEIVTTAALSLLASLGDLMLPAALAATLAAQVTGVEDRRKVLRLCIVPALLAVGVAVLMLIFAPQIGRWFQ